MKKIFFTCTMLLAMGFSSRAQLLKNLKGIVKSKVEQKVANKTGEETDKILNGNKKEDKPAQPAAEPAAETKPKQQEMATAWSKFDFVAGEKIIYTDDFAEAARGELPVGWNASGKGETVMLETQAGQWLRIFPGNMYLSGNTKAFGEDYTVEFDVVMTGTPPSGTRFFPDFSFGLLSTGKASTTQNSFLEATASINNKIQVTIKPNVDRISTIKLESTGQASSAFFKSGMQDIAEFNETLNRPAHYSIQVQKQRFRMWINEKKVFDIPRAVSLAPALNQLYFKPAAYWPYNESNFGLYLSNFKVASGVADSRRKLTGEGKFSTSGILFASGSGLIAPQSYGILREIGQVLVDNPSMRFRITGHTDNDGNVRANESLSIQRAEAVVKYLSDNFKINPGNLEFDGKGSSMPLADNKTKEGKAMNRRVEFTKIG